MRPGQSFSWDEDWEKALPATRPFRLISKALCKEWDWISFIDIELQNVMYLRRDDEDSSRDSLDER